MSEQGSFDWSRTGRPPRIVPEGVIGRDVARVDGRVKVRGEARYGADHQPTGVAHAALATATIARGVITSMNDSAARAMPGVLAVLTHHNVGDAIQPGKWVFDGGHMATAIAPLADGRVHYAGQIVALVVAETFEVAQAGAMALEVSYEREHAAATFGDAGAEEVEPRPLGEAALSAGDLERGFAAADVTVAADYATPAQHNNPLELFQATCAWEGEDLTIWESTQNLRGTQHGVASQLGVDPERVRVVSPVVGGGFGSRGEPGQMTAIVALASRRLGRPVKLVATRQQMLGPYLEPLPALLRTFITTLILVPIMTYVLLPAAQRLFARWLRAGS